MSSVSSDPQIIVAVFSGACLLALLALCCCYLRIRERRRRRHATAVMPWRPVSAAAAGRPVAVSVDRRQASAPPAIYVTSVDGDRTGRESPPPSYDELATKSTAVSVCGHCGR